MKKNFLTIFPLGENVHLTKDVGMIPYVLMKEGYYNSKISFYCDESDLPSLRKEVEGLEYKRIKKYSKYEELNILYFLLVNISNLDVVMLFHPGKKKLLIALIIKLLTLNRVKFYFKMDANENIKKQNFRSNGIMFSFYSFLYSFIDLISCETKDNHRFLNNNSYFKVSYIPNGTLESRGEINNKKKLFITVARIGSYEKDNLTLLKAIEKLDLKEWTFKLIGPIENTFNNTIEDFFNRNPHLQKSVCFTGPIYDKDILEFEYAQAKVFILTSRSEGFPLSLVEAVSNGCYIVSTDLMPAREVTNNGNYGKLFEIEDFERLATVLQEIIDCKLVLPDPLEIKDYADVNFQWKNIVKNIYRLLN